MNQRVECRLLAYPKNDVDRMSRGLDWLHKSDSVLESLGKIIRMKA